MEKTRILVVDDEQEICDVTRNFLAKQDYEVFTAQNIQQAIDSLQKDKPHLMLLDVRLGAESGMDILRKAKELYKSIKVIMVTALDDEETIRQAKSLGADDYITKPFTVDFLRDFVLQKIKRLSK